METPVPAEALTDTGPQARVETSSNRHERVVQLEGDFKKVAEAYAEKRTHSRQAQIDALRADGARPFKVFTQIVGEYSRADNIFCGINGEADHRVVAGYLRQEAMTEVGDTKDVLAWLATKGDELADHRGVVKDFLILDQLTDPKNYEEGRVVDEDTGFFNSSLGDIDTRVLPEVAKNGIVGRISETSAQVASWKQQRSTYATMGAELLPLVNPRNPESMRPVVENGTRSDGPGNGWREAMDSAEAWIQSTSGIINEGDLQKAGGAMLGFMDKLTGAQAILESQYYHVGVGLLRSAASRNLPEVCRIIIKSDLGKVGAPATTPA